MAGGNHGLPRGGGWGVNGFGGGGLKLVGANFREIGRPALLRDGDHINTNSASATASPPGCHMC